MKHLTLKRVVAVAAFLSLAIGGVVYANPSYFGPTVQTNAATSSPAVMAPGTATTTLTYDSYSNPTSNHFRADRASLAVQFAGQSPSSKIAIDFEYSNDGIDWYKSYITDPIGTGTTSPTFVLGAPNRISWPFASSTLQGVAPTAANGATSTAIFSLPTPTRYTRAVITNTGATSSVWAQIIPIKEQF